MVFSFFVILSQVPSNIFYLEARGRVASKPSPPAGAPSLQGLGRDDPLGSGRKSIVFRAISWPSGMKIRPTGLLRGHFLFLTSIRDWIYHFFVMGDIVAKLNGT